MALAAVDEHDLPRAAIEQCRDRHDKALGFVGARVDLHVGEHLVLDAVVGFFTSMRTLAVRVAMSSSCRTKVIGPANVSPGNARNVTRAGAPILI